MRLARCLAATLAVTVMSSAGWAQAEPRSWGHGFFVAGSSPGEPSTEKQVVIYGLYGLAGVSTVAGGISIWSWSSAESERETLLQENPGPCADLASEVCRELRELNHDANTSLYWGLGGVSMGLGLVASGVILAGRWPNAALEPVLSVAPSGGFAGARLRF